MSKYKRIALFRYHNNLQGCKNRLDLFLKINPSIDVYGVYGGKEEEFEIYESGLSAFLKDNFCVRGKEAQWKWLHGDLVFRMWYYEYGKNLDFDFAHILEWDLLYLEPLESLYRHITPDKVAVTGLIELKRIEKKWFWLFDPEQNAKWEKLKAHVAENLGYTGTYFASMAPGLCMPKLFLEKYSSVDVPELAHDELRLPLYAKALGFELFDTGFYKKWFSKREWRFFNCNEFDIKLWRIKWQMKKKNGRRVFHPYRSLINVDMIMKYVDKNMSKLINLDN